MFIMQLSMKFEGDERVTNEQPKRFVDMSNRSFPHGRPSRKLLFVKLAFWAVLLGFILLIAFILWGLATHGPSQSPFDSGPDPA
jgi:cytoskeletal protein RodZ